ncbi:fimbria/pilus outer membrane usher protein [Stenotrophomonas tumulicola]|uniref:Fimbrial biogenesis outer membrane usher protein n=1 Tax=Stenotrophomonas tumulicola TaxID=1685415 RepID=A0A7W3FLQ6_9GAMM|nr:fimbria/pilus outer membrane usher protein [Stenotrophomonas tumulicola]MBA8681556.1 fimbrial biogenesis outer membrane usher protein [Stenotrophomonas tumulicola]
MLFRRLTPPTLQTRRLAAAVAAALLPAMACAAPNVAFNPNFLQGEQAGQIDLTRFEQGDDLPGIYSADIKVNGVIVARRDIELRALESGAVAICLSPQVTEVFGVDPARLPRPGEVSEVDGVPVDILPLPDTMTCEDISRYIPNSTARFDAGEQVLEVSIPQAYLARDPRGWVSPELWDDGINAALLGYSVSHQRMFANGQARQSTSAMLNAGVNLGGWRFRHDGYLSQGSGRRTEYRAGRTYAQRTIAPWGMQLTAGEASTNGDLFDGVSFRGVSISTDPRMLPDSQRDYAPVVRGVAQTSAKVVIRQSDNVLYQTNVAAGPFEISDLYGTAYAGDLDVEVIENDGRVQHFVVPFAAVPELLRAGQRRVSATIGTLRDNWLRDAPAFAEGTLRVGLGNRFTAFGGATGSDGYRAVVLGGALNTSIGAFSGDVTIARTQLPTALESFGRTMQGQSYRLAYSKDIVATRTNIAVAAYRYSTDGYLSLGDAARLRQELADGGDGNLIGRQRSRLDLNLSQRLGEGSGALYANGSSMEYWNQGQRRVNFALGYSDMFGPASYSLSVQRSVERNQNGGTAREGNSINFTLNMPLGGRVSAPRLSTSLNRRNDGRDDVRAGITGSFGEHRQGSYSAAASHNGGQGGSYDAGLSYQASAASLNAGYSHSSGSRGLSLGASGGVVLHGDGVAFAQQLGETIAVVHVPDAAGAALDGTTGVKTDAKGYAVVPYMTPYRRNEVTIDPKGLPMDVELKTASVIGVPTAGAVVKLVVPTSSGRSALIEAPQVDGKPLPFGLDVYNEAGEVVGVVGQASRLWVRGIEESGRLTVRWGQEAGQQCVIDYDLEGADAGGMLASQCRAPQ